MKLHANIANVIALLTQGLSAMSPKMIAEAGDMLGAICRQSAKLGAHDTQQQLVFLFNTDSFDKTNLVQ